MKNIALIGLSGSGKATVARLLEQEANYQPCKSGTVCREISSILFGNESRSNLNALTDALKTISEDILIAAALRRADTGNPVLIDSLRYQSDYDFAKSSGFFIIRVSAASSECIERLKKRGQEFDPSTDLAHASEVTLINHPSDYEIKNDAAMDSLEQQVLDLIRSNKLG